MIDRGRRNVLGVLVDVVDYDGAAVRLLAAAREGRPFAGTALAVHGVMTGVLDDVHRGRLNELDLVTPDGQPVRWALNWLHGAQLARRVCGPELMRRLCAEAAAEGLPVYLYGSTPAVVGALRRRLAEQHPELLVAGAEASKFRAITAAERDELAARIRDSGAGIVFVGLGCPRQETFVRELRDVVGRPMLAVGAAFDYHAGRLREPPLWMQESGLHWLHRLAQDPGRLWHRYLVLGPAYLVRLVAQRIGAWRPETRVAPVARPASGVTAPAEAVVHG